MIGARRGSPLAIGYGEGEMFFGSDALALAPLTRRISYLEEGDWAVLTHDSAEVFDTDSNPLSVLWCRRPFPVPWWARAISRISC